MKADRASWTARWVATQRAALDDRRPVRGDAGAEQRLYRDLSIPWLRLRVLAPSGMDVRTRFVDTQLAAALDRGVRQVVVLGAGYDGRALRFSDSGATWIEVDHPATQADKRRRLAKVGARSEHITFVAADLITGDLDRELQRVGHDPHQPTVWVCEGLFPYLPRATIAALGRTLRGRSHPDSTLVCNVLIRDQAHLLSRAVRLIVDLILAGIGERRLAEFAPGDVERLLVAAGWTVEVDRRTHPTRADRTYMLGVVARPAE